jgi:hypothetical protein
MSFMSTVIGVAEEDPIRIEWGLLVDREMHAPRKAAL